MTMVALNPPTVWSVPTGLRHIYSHAVKTEAAGVSFLHVSGQLPVRLAGTIPTDFAEQCDAAMTNVEELLRCADMTIEHIVKLTFYLVRRDRLPVLAEMRRTRWPGVRPAVTVLLVAGLVSEEYEVEIDVLAQRNT